MSRRKFNKEFKVAAVKLILDDELPIYQVARERSVHANSLYRWVNEYEHYGESAFSGNGTKIYDYQAEIHRLGRRNRELEEEVELLKNSGSSCRKKAREIQVSGGTKAPIRDQEGLYDIGNLSRRILYVPETKVLRPATRERVSIKEATGSIRTACWSIWRKTDRTLLTG